MLKRDLQQLAVYEIDKDVDEISFTSLRSLYMKKTSEIIYIMKDKKLYGIICMKEAFDMSSKGEVHINKNFTMLIENDVIKAKEIFKRNYRINEIPIVNKEGRLLGDYSRWDDIFYIERCSRLAMKEDAVKKLLEPYNEIYVIEPVDAKCTEYLYMLNCFCNYGIKYVVLPKNKISERLSEKSICIVFNEEELRGIYCLYQLKPQLYDNEGFDIFQFDGSQDRTIRFVTYKNLLIKLKQEICLRSLNIIRPEYMPYERIDYKADRLLSYLCSKGIKCFCMPGEELQVTDSWKKYRQRTAERLKENPISLKTPWSKGEDDAKFYDELYELEDYKNQTAQKEIFDSNICYEYKRNLSGKYFDAVDGHRITCFQPDQYVGTIYILGLCIIVGRHVEDQYTIESWLQKYLSEKGYHYRVENYGFESRVDSGIDVRLEEIGRYSPNDIVIYMSGLGESVNIKGISVEKIFEKYNVPDDWVMDMYSHCNHKANKCIANEMFEMVKPYLLHASEENLTNCQDDIQIEMHDVMADYVERKYIRQYFNDFCGEKYNSVGAVVMKGDPFSYGHRYLVEQALQQVEFLIIFVIEEDIYQFSFEERYRMIVEGTSDLENVMVVPNDDFVFSRKTYWEYYRPREEGVAVLNAEYDINLFADYIAKPLHITHRFVGQDIKEQMVLVYNEVLKRILPQKGIHYIEVPAISSGDEKRYTSQIRRFLKNKEYDKLCSLIPKRIRPFVGIDEYCEDMQGEL